MFWKLTCEDEAVSLLAKAPQVTTSCGSRPNSLLARSASDFTGSCDFMDNPFGSCSAPPPSPVSPSPAPSPQSSSPAIAQQPPPPTPVSPSPASSPQSSKLAIAQEPEKSETPAPKTWTITYNAEHKLALRTKLHARAQCPPDVLVMYAIGSSLCSQKLPVSLFKACVRGMARRRRIGANGSCHMKQQSPQTAWLQCGPMGIRRQSLSCYLMLRDCLCVEAPRLV